jgi:hypothetical protein
MQGLREVLARLESGLGYDEEGRKLAREPGGWCATADFDADNYVWDVGHGGGEGVSSTMPDQRSAPQAEWELPPDTAGASPPPPLLGGRRRCAIGVGCPPSVPAARLQHDHTSALASSAECLRHAIQHGGATTMSPRATSPASRARADGRGYSPSTIGPRAHRSAC